MAGIEQGKKGVLQFPDPTMEKIACEADPTMEKIACEDA
jgi:hypothetical protein